MEIAGKTAIVTGAGGGGQGRAMAFKLARSGAAVVVSDIDESGGRETVRQIEQNGGKGIFFRADVSRKPEMQSLIQAAGSTFGGPDILVNNAGPYFPGHKLERWDETLSANLFGPIWTTLHAIEPMRQRGGGAIVYYGSTSAIGHGLKHSPSPAYDVAKQAVIRLTTTMSWLKGAYGIRTNCIVPDWVATEEVQAYVNSLTPNERQARGVPDSLIALDEISAAVLRLIADDNLNGRILVWRNGAKPGLVPAGDAGYERLEQF